LGAVRRHDKKTHKTHHWAGTGLKREKNGAGFYYGKRGSRKRVFENNTAGTFQYTPLNEQKGVHHDLSAEDRLSKSLREILMA